MLNHLFLRCVVFQVVKFQMSYLSRQSCSREVRANGVESDVKKAG